MEPTTDEPAYTLSIPTVVRAVEHLSGRRTHEQFPGYLLLHHLGVGENIPIDSAALNRARLAYLGVGGAPKKRPFIQAFRSRGRGPKLDNANSAGSYSATSIRYGQTLAKVVTTVDTNETKSGIAYRFRPGHAETVLSAMLGGRPVKAGAVAAFLLRDYALQLDPSRSEQFLELFRDWLRMGAESEDPSIFDALFEDDADEFSSEDFVPVAD